MKKKIAKNKSAPDRTFEKTPGSNDTKQITDAEVDEMIRKIGLLTYGQITVVKKAASNRLAQVR
jgi:hypothetical protein